MRRSIKYKILASHLVLVLLAAFIFGSVSYRLLIDNLVEAQRQRMELLASYKAAAIQVNIGHRRDLIMAIAQSEATERYAADYAYYSLDRLFLENNRIFPAMSFVNGEGVEEIKFVRGRESDDYQDYSGTSWFQAAVSEPNVVHLAFFPPQGDAVAGIAFIYGHQNFFGEFGGIILGVAPLADLVRPIAGKRVGDTGYFTIVDGTGTVLSHPDPRMLFSRIAPKSSEADPPFPPRR